MSISITRLSENKEIKVESPFNSRWTSEAKRLGGRWSAYSKTWIFDERNEEFVREALKDVYGTDGDDCSEMVTLRIEWRKDGRKEEGAIELSGRTIARAFGRDSGAKLGEGVILLEGAFGSGGSRSNWETNVRAGTVVLVHDVPRKMAEMKISKNSETSTRIYSIHKEEACVDVDALQVERTRLLERLAVIDSLIAANPKKVSSEVTPIQELCDTPD